jgi:hypothetical protein
MLAGGLAAPTDTAAGVAAGALAPGVSYEIGQWFKANGTEGSAAHLLAHAVLGAAAAAAGGNSALAGAVAAGGTEASAAALSEWLYGKQPEDLTAEQKAAVSAIAGLAGDIAGGVAGKSPADVAEGGLAAHAAVDNNQEVREEERKADAEPVYRELLYARAIALIREIKAKGGSYLEIWDPSKPKSYTQADIFRLEDTLRRYAPNDSLLQSDLNSPILMNSPYNLDAVENRIKPPYADNPAHDSYSSTYNPRKSPLPFDAEEVYQTAVRGGFGEWYGKGVGGYYRYSSDNVGHEHFSGVLPESDVPLDALIWLNGRR